MARTVKQERERAERYRRRCSVLLRALEGCISADQDWSGGLGEIYEFIRAKRLIKRYRQNDVVNA